MFTAYRDGRDAALLKYAARRSVKEVRARWGDDLEAPKHEQLDSRGFTIPSPAHDQHEMAAAALSKHRQSAMDYAERLDQQSKGTAFKQTAGGTQLKTRGAGEYGGGMEGMATPVIQGGMGGVVARKHHFPEAVREGLATPRHLAAKREVVNTQIPLHSPHLAKHVVKHHGTREDRLGMPVDFWENVPGWQAKTMGDAIKATGHGGAVAAEVNNTVDPTRRGSIAIGDTHYQNDLKLPGGQHKLVDFAAVQDSAGAIPWPWQGRTKEERVKKMEAARMRQATENRPVAMARRFDSPEAVKQKEGRGGYAENPDDRVKRLKAQRAQLQTKEQTPEARTAMKQLQETQRARAAHLARPEHEWQHSEIARLDETLRAQKAQMAAIRKPAPPPPAKMPGYKNMWETVLRRARPGPR